MTALLAQQEYIEKLVYNVKKSIQTYKGEAIMTDKARFDGFKNKLIHDNEVTYGEEVRSKYGNEATERAHAKVRGMTQEQFAHAKQLAEAYQIALREAFAEGTGDPASKRGQEACDLHRQWLSCYYDNYSKEYHKSLAEMYVTDSRFTAHYDEVAQGCAPFFRDAIEIYCGT